MNHYECLNIKFNATTDEIRAAYKIKAKAHHPDLFFNDPSKQKEQAEIFKKIVEAFEILSDANKRTLYDLKIKPQPKPKPKPQPKPQVKPEHKGRPVSEPVINCMFFGGESSGRSILVHIKITEAELKKGCQKTTTIKKRDFCNTCGGDGGGVLFTCPVCRGIHHTVCSHCDYTGQIQEKECKHCNGTGFGGWITEDVSFMVPPNSKPGSSITVMGQGECASRKPPGNLRIVFV